MMKRLMMLFGFLALLIVPVFSQEIWVFSEKVPVYDTLWDLLADSRGVFLTIAGFVGATVFVSGLLNTQIGVTGNWPKRIVSWIVAGVFCVVANLANIFLLADATALQTVAYTVSIGLVANGFFTIPQVLSFLQYLKLEVKKKV